MAPGCLPPRSGLRWRHLTLALLGSWFSFLTSLGRSELLTYLSLHYSAFSRRVPTVLNTILICFDEVLRLVPGLSDGVVVALVGDVVLVSRPCWLHITRKGLL